MCDPKMPVAGKTPVGESPEKLNRKKGRKEREHETTLLGGTAVFCDAVVLTACQRTCGRGGHAETGDVRDGGKQPRVYSTSPSMMQAMN